MDEGTQRDKGKLIFNLLRKLTNIEEAEKLFVKAAKTLGKYSSKSSYNDYIISENIKKRINGSVDAQNRFCEIHRKLITQRSLSNHSPVLLFLLKLNELKQQHDNITLDGDIVIEDSISPSERFKNVTIRRKMDGTPSPKGNLSLKSDYSSSMGTSSVPLLELSPIYPFESKAGGISYGSDSDLQNITGARSVPVKMPVTYIPIPTYKSNFSETTLIQELLYCFSGIEGKILKLDPASNGYKIHSDIEMPLPRRRQLLRLAELGWCHNQLKMFCDEARTVLQPAGLVLQSLVSALRNELTEYYRFIALLQSQLKDEVIDSPLSEEQYSSASNTSSLCKLEVWVMEPLERHKTLISIIRKCKGKRGGALISSVHSFLKHGDPAVRSMTYCLLSAVCKPLFVMLGRWILDGMVEDSYNEFFIAADHDVKGDRLWHDKYHLRESLLPSFISVDQAKKILATGKSINFLREVCEDKTPVKGREMLRRVFECKNVETLYMPDRDGDLDIAIDSAYLETSQRVLNVLHEKYKFMMHLQALRKYLLLGQGDFIRHLMELLDPELQKPASQLYPHNLSRILESAIRATNAQFEEADILNRLDVRLLETSRGDVGWDVFTLDYHVDGPIGTIFVTNKTSYLMLFNALWRAKRMEYILNQSWKRQVTSSKSLLRKLPELEPTFRQINLLISEMVHFVQQMQYYTLFEVLECSWHAFTKQVKAAESLDNIIAAHDDFLNTVKAGVLLDENSQELAMQLRSVYELILDLQQLVDQLHSRALSELNYRSKYEDNIEHEFGGETGELEEAEKTRRHSFVNVYLNKVRTQFQIQSKSYQEVVKKFLLKLANQPELTLQLLSFRLDFSEHYKRLDSKLELPFTYQHRRQSEFNGLKSRIK